MSRAILYSLRALLANENRIALVRRLRVNRKIARWRDYVDSLAVWQALTGKMKPDSVQAGAIDEAFEIELEICDLLFRRLMDRNSDGGLVHSLQILRASRLRMCFVNTPEERNLAPCFISSRSTLSPSSLIHVRPFKSTTSSRPSKSAVTCRHTVVSSETHGPTSLPSTTNRRQLTLSKIEIFNMAFTHTGSHAKPIPNLRRRKSLIFQENMQRS